MSDNRAVRYRAHSGEVLCWSPHRNARIRVNRGDQQFSRCPSSHHGHHPNNRNARPSTFPLTSAGKTKRVRESHLVRCIKLTRLPFYGPIQSDLISPKNVRKHQDSYLNPPDGWPGGEFFHLQGRPNDQIEPQSGYALWRQVIEWCLKDGTTKRNTHHRD